MTDEEKDLYSAGIEVGKRIASAFPAGQGRKIIDYTICEGADSHKLTIEIFKKIEQGWQPWFGLVVYGKYAWQAMVKFEGDE